MPGQRLCARPLASERMGAGDEACSRLSAGAQRRTFRDQSCYLWIEAPAGLADWRRWQQLSANQALSCVSLAREGRNDRLAGWHDTCGTYLLLPGQPGECVRARSTCTLARTTRLAASCKGQGRDHKLAGQERRLDRFARLDSAEEVNHWLSVCPDSWDSISKRPMMRTIGFEGWRRSGARAIH